MIDNNLKQIVSDAQLDWAVVMGVPVGYGGQIFQFNTLGRISALHDFVMELGRDFLIECDGGLTLETARLCKNAGSQIFAGWSIVKAPTLNEISGKVEVLKQVLEGASTI
jgi:pentose-5-phosphate-3-epimerase